MSALRERNRVRFTVIPRERSDRGMSVVPEYEDKMTRTR